MQNYTLIMYINIFSDTDTDLNAYQWKIESDLVQICHCYKHMNYNIGGS